MKNIVKFVIFALALVTAVTGTALILKKSAERIEAGADEDIMFIG